MEAGAVLARADVLRAEVAAHNAAIRRHRKQRREALDALTRLDAECRRLGIRLVLMPQRSEGAAHGDVDSHP